MHSLNLEVDAAAVMDPKGVIHREARAAELEKMRGDLTAELEHVRKAHRAVNVHVPSRA